MPTKLVRGRYNVIDPEKRNVFFWVYHIVPPPSS